MIVNYNINNTKKCVYYSRARCLASKRQIVVSIPFHPHKIREYTQNIRTQTHTQKHELTHTKSKPLNEWVLKEIYVNYCMRTVILIFETESKAHNQQRRNVWKSINKSLLFFRLWSFIILDVFFSFCSIILIISVFLHFFWFSKHASNSFFSSFNVDVFGSCLKILNLFWSYFFFNVNPFLFEAISINFKYNRFVNNNNRAFWIQYSSFIYLKLKLGARTWFIGFKNNMSFHAF